MNAAPALERWRMLRFGDKIRHADGTVSIEFVIEP